MTASIILGALLFWGNPGFSTEVEKEYTESEQIIESLEEQKRTGRNASILGATIVVLGGTVATQGGAELGLSVSIAGVAISALGCHTSFKAGRQLRRFLEALKGD
ncbi:MAG: hypothetical protein OXB86_04640 [Bdellovibrionales bacterium]|nr:hypothetical protein [Bdellovibrionales bacterium]